MSTRGINTEEFAQALRVSHCSKGAEALHACVGTCTITAKGVELDCKLCGKDSKPIAPNALLRETQIARDVCEAIGLDWDAITDARKRDAVKVIEKHWRNR